MLIPLVFFLIYPLLLIPHVASAQFEDIFRGLDTIGESKSGIPGHEKIVAGLKEALRLGTEKAVTLTGTPNGFLQNEAIKILLPEKLQSMDKALRLAGLGPQVDDLVLSMNRAAERAAPLAGPIFKEAVTNMSFEDADKILHGGDTAATDYFRTSTWDQLTAAFTPEVEQAMAEVGVTAQYKQLAQQYTTLPFVQIPAFDVDKYVVGKTLDGLFLMVAQEEQQIRTDPSARVTGLLQDVFGN